MFLPTRDKLLLAFFVCIGLWHALMSVAGSADRAPLYTCECDLPATTAIPTTSFASTGSQICISPRVRSCWLHGSVHHADWNRYPTTLNDSVILFADACYSTEQEAMKEAVEMCMEPNARLWGAPMYIRGELILIGKTSGTMRWERIFYIVLATALMGSLVSVLWWARQTIRQVCTQAGVY